MKTLAILLVLLATTAFAYDPLLQPVSLLESGGVIYVIDATPEVYVPPEPVDTSVKAPEFINNIKKDPGSFILEWVEILRIAADSLD